MVRVLIVMFILFSFRCWATGVLAVAATRMSCGAALGPADAVAVPVVAVGWSFQEWAIHKYLLHGLEVTILLCHSGA